MPIDVTSLYDRRADNRWDRVCVGDILERVTWSRPDQVAIVGWPGAFADPACERLTYRQANDIVNRFANGLLARGLRRGDRVLLVCENSVEAYLAKLATAKAGLVAVPVNPSLAQSATERAFRHGWFHSGDSCVVDEDGLRIMVDRYKDIIKSGGENVSSLRVEAVLHQHPDVAKSAVIGLPHDQWGEAVTAIVVCEPGRQPDAAELIAFCRERLAGFESPKAIVFADALPETVGGKVLKYKLRLQLAHHYAHTATP